VAIQSFYKQITDSIRGGKFADGVRVEPVAMHTTGIGRVQLLDVDFGLKLAGGTCKNLFYTFTSELSIDENLEDFRDFVKRQARRAQHPQVC
jgi:hypothetical protein